MYVKLRAENVFHLLVDRKGRDVGDLCGLVVHDGVIGKDDKIRRGVGVRAVMIPFARC